MSTREFPCCSPMLRLRTKTRVDEVLELTNWIRHIHGARMLRLDPQLMKSAQAKAEHMYWVGYFDHVSPYGDGPPSHVGENLSMGHLNVRNAMEGLRLSKGHHDNMIARDYTRLGVGIELRPNRLFTNYTRFLVQHFA